MNPSGPESDVRLVYLDPELVERVRDGLTDQQLAAKAKIDPRTLKRIYEKQGVLPSSAVNLANALGREMFELLARWDRRYVPRRELDSPVSGALEWETIGYLEQGRLASNGLYYIVCRMRHRHTRGRAGRGKFYHLSWLPKKEEMRHQLSRHAETCVRVGAHPHLPINLVSTPTPGGDGWWVIDDWIGEKTLADHLEQGSWRQESLPRLLHEIALGLDVLHQSDIIVRELAPSRVLIADKDGRAVLTDFELAKLLDGSPSVSSNWPEDPFRAPEIDGGTATVRSDLYSLGYVTAATVTGRIPAAGEAKAILSDARLPKRLGSLLLKCVEPIPDRRPEGIAPVLKELQRWSKG